MNNMNNQYSASSLYAGGWRAADRDEIMEEYSLSAAEADKIAKELAEIEAAE